MTNTGLPGQVRELTDSLAREPWGQVSPSVYETGRLVALTPWLAGHVERVGFLLGSQGPDGAWGAPDGYGCVPTLSATESLLCVLRDGTGPPQVAGAAARGLQALTGVLELSIPDTPAVDLIVPALVARINGHLDGFDGALPDWSGGRLSLPPGMTAARLDAVRHLLASGSPVPEKLLHALEVVGEQARGLVGVRPSAAGTVGASPAATAAWLGGPDGDASALSWVEETAGRDGGPVPCTTPIAAFERSWVVTGLARVGIALPPLPWIADSLAAALGPDGAPGAPGLPTDADTTSVVLAALGRLGRPAELDCLWRYDTGEYFCTWPGEDGYSVTTNAHVLDAFGQHLTSAPSTVDDVRSRYAVVVGRLSDWLRGQQDPAGYWQDRWHASPYYATACAALALGEYGSGAAATEAVGHALDWILASQRADGGWGRWHSTMEETAYALQVLLTTRSTHPGIDAAALRGYAYLCDVVDANDGPALWHDKDLYRPTAIVRAAVLSALHLLQARARSQRWASLPPARFPAGDERDDQPTLRDPSDTASVWAR